MAIMIGTQGNDTLQIKDPGLQCKLTETRLELEQNALMSSRVVLLRLIVTVHSVKERVGTSKQGMQQTKTDKQDISRVR